MDQSIQEMRGNKPDEMADRFGSPKFVEVASGYEKLMLQAYKNSKNLQFIILLQE
jgi:hypothetical protein